MKINQIFLVSCFAVLSLSSAAQIPNYIPNDGLVAWWPFNGNANDESGNNNNGSVLGAELTTDRNNQPGNAYYFDGNNDWIFRQS